MLSALYKELLASGAFLVDRVILRKTHQVSVTVVLLTGLDTRDIRISNTLMNSLAFSNLKSLSFYRVLRTVILKQVY